MSFKSVSSKPDFVKMERKLLDQWHQSGLVKKYLHKNDQSKNYFSFLDGPITANNPMGVHHAWGRTLKDFYQRYHNMKGEKQRFQNGFDCQGLWVEVEVEKELGFKSKKDIEKYGIAKFIEKCKERVKKYSQIQTEQSKRLGYFMDWENSYYTMSDENNYMIWFFLKKCWQDGNLYKGRDTVPWCPRCGTAISQHEILTEEYKEVTHKAVYFKYPVIGRKKEFFLVWTTSPWTIPANIALAVNPELKYGRFKNKVTGEILILLVDLALKIFGKDKNWEKIEEFLGVKLNGLYYQGIFDDLPRNKKAKKENPKTFHIVFLEKDLVTADEGTGIVHISPGSGPEDYQLAKREKLPVTEVINESGFYLGGYGSLTGKNAKDNPELVFDILKKKEGGKFFYKIEDYKHRYPVCWRCKTELVWRVVEEWYIGMDQKTKNRTLREKMIAVAKKIKWIPGWGLERELDWLRNMDDWLISKKRYWGLALPIWECQCGNFEVIGSKEELKKKAVEGWQGFEVHTPHRPWVDKVKIRCSKCRSLMNRIPDVGNPWLDAGVVSFSTLRYRTDKKYWRKWFPADFITENFHGQFKNWFYSLIAMSTVLVNKEPYRAVLAHALVRDEKGEEMHKSKGNAIKFDEAAEKMGADVMRWMYLAHNPRLNLNFGFHIGDKTRRRFHLILWNIYRYFKMQNAKFKMQNCNAKFKNILDRWIISRLHETIKLVTENINEYDNFSAVHVIEDFVQDLSTWYLRRSREREDKKLFSQTLYMILLTSSKILAPFIPFMAEEIYQNLKVQKFKSSKVQSVHLESWPKVDSKLIDKDLEMKMSLVRQICELGHSARKRAKIKVRQPLLLIKVKSEKLVRLNEQLVQLIKDELNIKEVIFKKVKGELKAELDTKITPELRAEGEARELVRKIQNLRRKQGCKLDEHILVYAPDWPKKFENYIKKKTLSKALLKGKKLEIK